MQTTINPDLFSHLVNEAFKRSNTGRVAFGGDYEDEEPEYLTAEEWEDWDINKMLSFSFDTPICAEVKDDDGSLDLVVVYR